MSIAIRNAISWKGVVLPALTAGLALAAAVIGAFFTGEAAVTGGLNGFVETLSGRSTSYLGGLSILAPLGIAFVAGMVASVNPCGFAMLPAYLGLYMGSQDKAWERASPLHRLARAVMVSGVVTAGFVVLFGIAGVAIDGGVRSMLKFIPWLGLSIGVVLAIAGSWVLGGGQLYTSLAGRAADRIGSPGQVGVRGYFLFGISYGLASLGCVLPVFMLVVFTTREESGVPLALGRFMLYGMGMGLVILILTVGMALFKEAIVGFLRRVMPYFQPLTAGLMIVAGAYIVYYWLTIGDLK